MVTGSHNDFSLGLPNKIEELPDKRGGNLNGKTTRIVKRVMGIEDKKGAVGRELWALVRVSEMGRWADGVPES